MQNVENLLSFEDDKTLDFPLIINLITRAREIDIDTITTNGDNVLVHNHLWSRLFIKVFINPYLNDINKSSLNDDIIIFVNDYHRNMKKPELSIFRRTSSNLPTSTSTHIDWEETVYLNLLMQYFVYVITVAVFTRTGSHEWQILKKVSQQVYASPTQHNMNSKGNKEKIVFPDLVFSIENYDELFNECIVYDSECLAIELAVYDKTGQSVGMCFLGSLSYSTLKSLYDIERKPCTDYFYRCFMSAGNSKSNLEKLPKYVRIVGPKAKGHVEIALNPMNVDSDYGKANFMKQSIDSCCDYLHATDSQTKLDYFGFDEDSMCFMDAFADEYSVITTEPCDKKTGELNRGTVSAGCSLPTSPVRKSRFRTRPANNVSNPIALTFLNKKIRFSEHFQNKLKEQKMKSTKISDILNQFTNVQSPSNKCDTGLEHKYCDNNDDNNNHLNMSYSETEFKLNPESPKPNHPPTNKSDLWMSLENANHNNGDAGFFNTNESDKQLFGQPWSWFKERRKRISTGFNASLTFICIPYQNILLDLMQTRREPILNFSNYYQK